MSYTVHLAPLIYPVRWLSRVRQNCIALGFLLSNLYFVFAAWLYPIM